MECIISDDANPLQVGMQRRGRSTPNVIESHKKLS
jgi:hypothetical protein